MKYVVCFHTKHSGDMQIFSDSCMHKEGLAHGEPFLLF